MYFFILTCWNFKYRLDKMNFLPGCFAVLLTSRVRCSCSGQRASQHRIEQRRQVHSSLAGAVRWLNDALAADRCGSLSARVIIVICASMSLMLEDWSRGSKGAEALPKAVIMYCILTEEKWGSLHWRVTERKVAYVSYKTEPLLVISSTCASPTVIRRNVWRENAY